MFIKNTFIVLSSILILILFLSPSATGSTAGENPLSPAQMIENLQFIKAKLSHRHPNLYHASSEEEFKRVYAEAMEDIKETLSPLEFYFIANRLIMLLKDAHTKLVYNYESDRLPLKLIYLPDGLGIVESPLFPEIQSTRVIAISGVTPDEWFKRIASMRTHESDAFVRWKTEEFLLYNYIYNFYLKNTDITEVAIEVQKKDESLRVSIPFISNDEWKKVFREDKKNDNFFSYRFYEEMSAGYFELSACNDTEKYRVAVDEFMKKLKDNKYNNLIIDLRNNHGGVTSVLYAILKHMPGNNFKYGSIIKIVEGIKQPYKDDDIMFEITDTLREKESFTGNVYVLISQYTFSSGNEVAIVFRDNKLGTLVGQKTSNAPCCYGATSPSDLPHGKFTLWVSSNYWVTPKGDCEEDGVTPDIEIPITLDDVFKHRDPVMEWLNENLK